MDTKLVEFAWHPGLSVTQKQRSISEMHQSVHKNLNLNQVLEVSSKSKSSLGVALSAFNLQFTTKERGLTISVACAFQGSKVFTKGGPYTDIYLKSSLDAKRDVRLRESGPLLGFRFFNEEWPAQPLTAFYDWLYVNALHSRVDLCSDMLSYQAFTDIEFNARKSISCQAYSAALYVSLIKRRIFDEVARDQESFLTYLKETSLVSARVNEVSQKTLDF